ncbi:MAG: hypothetical protein ACXWM7_05535 [Parachlamydiaceae bacterium]
MKDKQADKSIKATLAKNHVCYVLLTCDGPKSNGQMQVEMSYEGDPVLASYLLQGAQTIIDNDAIR